MNFVLYYYYINYDDGPALGIKIRPVVFAAVPTA
jgi:hypothetical protein